MKIGAALRSRHFLIFCLIGVLNTAINAVVVISCVELLGSSQVSANTLAFLVANAGSYWANSRWNFKTRLSLSRYVRFLFSSLSVLVIVFLISAIADVYDIYYLYTLLIITVISPITSFLMVKYFAFR